MLKTANIILVAISPPILRPGAGLKLPWPLLSPVCRRPLAPARTVGHSGDGKRSQPLLFQEEAYAKF
jgi:hypothetical protein